MKGLPEALQRQYEYEDPIVRGGKQLLHSPFFKVCCGIGDIDTYACVCRTNSDSFIQVLVALACDLELDTLPCCAETHKWAWFRRYCTASRVAIALDKRTSLPRVFLDEVSPLRLWGHLTFLNTNDRKYFHKVNFVSVTSALIRTTESTYSEN